MIQNEAPKPSSSSSSSSSYSLPEIGITYNALPHRHHHHHHHLVSTLQSMNLNSVSLPEPDPQTTRLFSYSSISLLLYVPNSSLREISSNRSNALRWLNLHLLPFHPRVHVSAISVGDDIDPLSDLSPLLLPAMSNLLQALHHVGIPNISVSTTFSFARVMTPTPFPPSSARFRPDSATEALVKPILNFIAQTNSSFLVKLHPYHLYRSQPGIIPIGFALFQEDQAAPFNFRDDPFTGLRYRNLFDVMVDAVISGIESHQGHRGGGGGVVPVVVAETGWPSYVDGEGEAKDVYAEMYVKGLVRHLRSGLGTPMRRDGVAQVYIYELFDEEEDDDDGGSQRSKWGIMYDNMTQKYNVDFSSSSSTSAHHHHLIHLLLPNWFGLSVMMIILICLNL
ncbi:hypothetical protein Scep_005548 [Stephania cephalantha]|uniref:Glucan endo-1,3-beta-D-glucosidase n=1 Tax=Stephania cephalantha TaxID=152367 RepID=A0AAP0KW62_9MAGN